MLDWLLLKPLQYNTTIPIYLKCLTFTNTLFYLCNNLCLYFYNYKMFLLHNYPYFYT